MRSAQREEKRSIAIRLCTLPAMTLTDGDADVAITLNDSQSIDGILKCSRRTVRQTLPARLHQAVAQVSTECTNKKSVCTGDTPTNIRPKYLT